MASNASKFFDSYKDIGTGGAFVSGTEKTFLIDNGVVFTINGVVEDPDNEYGPRFITFCTIPNQDGEDEERKMGWQQGTVPTRDAMLKAMKEYLDNDGEPVVVKIRKNGRAVVIVNAEDGSE